MQSTARLADPRIPAMNGVIRKARRNDIMRKIAKIIAAGLELSARTTALREGMPWQPQARRQPDGHQRR
jgi:hypothetical protein